jgi:hypothetical protein
MAQEFFGSESAVFFTLGEVQENHARNVGGILRVGNVQVVSLSEVADAIPTVDIPYPHTNAPDLDYAVATDYLKRPKYEDERTRWVREFLKDKIDFGPKKKDTSLHIMHEADVFEPETVRHWERVISRLPHVDKAGSPSVSRPAETCVRSWEYTPFFINDRRITGDAPDLTSIFVDPIVSYSFASARYASGVPYNSPSGTPPSLEVGITFNYPTSAVISRTTTESPYKRNEDGDYITHRSQTEVVQRTYTPEIPERLKGPIDAIRKEYDAIARAAREENEFMYEMGGEVNIDIDRARQLAPLINLI